MGVRAGHVRETLSLLFWRSRLREKAWEALGLRLLLPWGGNAQAALTLLAAAVSHHGKAYELNNLPSPHLPLWEPAEEREPLEGLHEVAHAAREWFPQAFDETAAPLPSTPAFLHAFSGLTMLADWIASDSHPSAFPFSQQGSGPARIEFSRARAPVVLAELGLDPASARSLLSAEDSRESRIARILGMEGGVLRPAQFTVDALPRDRDGSITVLEAETGSGKTEAALLRFLALFEAGEVRGNRPCTPGGV